MPGAEGERGEEEEIDQRGERHEQDLEKPDAGETKPAERPVAPVKDFVPMLPETLQSAVSPAEALPGERGQSLGSFRPGNRVRRVDDARCALMQSESEIGVLR